MSDHFLLGLLSYVEREKKFHTVLDKMYEGAFCASFGRMGHGGEKHAT